ncbi:MAG: hypothetical protein ABIH70_09820 [Chloroflexota bacterium]
MKDIDIHKWIKDPIEKILIPSSDTDDAEVKAQQNRLRDAEKEISDIKKQLENVNGFIARPTDKDRTNFNEYQKLLDKYFTLVLQACGQLRKMLDTYNAKTIDSTRTQLVNSLVQEAAKIDQASQGLLK